MWISDVPTEQINPPAIYTAASMVSAGPGIAQSAHRLGVCQAINGENSIYPVSAAGTYVFNYLNREFEINSDGTARTDISARIIEEPKHGRLVQEYPGATDYTRHHYQYIPEVGFAGYDHFAMEAEAGGTAVQVYYTMSIGLPGEPNYAYGENGERVDDLSRCANPYWKISSARAPR